MVLVRGGGEDNSGLQICTFNRLYLVWYLSWNSLMMSMRVLVRF